MEDARGHKSSRKWIIYLETTNLGELESQTLEETPSPVKLQTIRMQMRFARMWHK